MLKNWVLICMDNGWFCKFKSSRILLEENRYIWVLKHFDFGLVKQVLIVLKHFRDLGFDFYIWVGSILEIYGC